MGEYNHTKAIHEYVLILHYVTGRRTTYPAVLAMGVNGTSSCVAVELSQQHNPFLFCLHKVHLVKPLFLSLLLVIRLTQYVAHIKRN